MNCYIPDYPRPQFVRKSWENLNGAWRFAFDDQDRGISLGWERGLTEGLTIQVPFTYETKRSGIGDETVHDRVWYSRSITLTREQMDSGHILIHFEGCDYHTILWVNGIRVGSHTGGYARFSFDITKAAREGENILSVQVTDSLDPQQPRGKQRWLRDSFGCWYVQTTGIWKTVWLETLPDAYIQNVKITPDVQDAAVEMAFEVSDRSYADCRLEIQVSFDGQTVSQASVQVPQRRVKTKLNLLRMDTSQWGLHLWSPETPELYDVQFRVYCGGELEDTVGSYFGMRDIRVDGAAILLNGAPLYQRLILDQGYWPDSHLTPPSEAALVEDIEKIQQLGYNGLRRHQKVEDERFLYWCDVKGLLVWSEMASTYDFGDDAVEAFLTQWTQVLRQNYNHPCIITWTPVNESWGVSRVKVDAAQQNLTQAVYHLTKSIDPYRPVIVNDGWEHTVSDILTLHDYEEDGQVFAERYQNHLSAILEGALPHNLSRTAFAKGFSYRGQPIIISEYGGIAYEKDEKDWGYGRKVATQEEFLKRFDAITSAIKALPYCCGFCYTQVTDVQHEMNGLMDMERNFKVDPRAIREINLREGSCLHRQGR